MLRTYEEFLDLPEGRVIQAYSLVETAPERVLALAHRARNNRAIYTISMLR